MGANDLTYGVKLTADSKQLVGEVRSAREEMVSLKKATDDLAASNRTYAVTSKETAEYVMGMSISESNAKDKAWALANGYKEVDGQLVRLNKTTQEASAINAGATRELMVLGHEAMTGNFSRMPGTMLVLANRSGLAASGMLGMAAAIALPVAALGALAVAIHEGVKEEEAMNSALAMTGNISGQTAGSLRAMAEQVSSTSSLTIGNAKDMSTAFAASGKIGAGAFQNVMDASASYARASGEDVGKVTEYMIKMFSDPAKGAEELNSKMHFLSVAEQDRIKTLQDTNHWIDAQNLLAVAFEEHLDKQTEKLKTSLGVWNDIKKIASAAWDAMGGMSHRDQMEVALGEATRAMIRASKAGNEDEAARYAAEVVRLRAQQAKEAADAQAAAAAAASNKEDAYAESVRKAQDPLRARIKLVNDLTVLQDNFRKNAESWSAEAAAAAVRTIHNVQQQIAAIDAPKKDGDKAYRAAIAGQEAYQRDLSGLIKSAGDEQKKLLDAGEISQADYIGTMKTLREADLRGQIESYRKEEAAAKAHKNTTDAIRYGGEAAKAQAQLDGLNKQAQLDFDALARKQRDAAAGITRPLDADYRKTDEARARAAGYDLMSASQQRLAQALDAVNDRARAAREALDVKFPERERESDAYRDALKKINDAEREAEQSTRDWAARQDELNASWERGADKALLSYLDQVKNVSAQSERVYTDAFRAMDEAGVQFVRHQKINWDSLIDGMINDLIRLQWQQSVTMPLVGTTGSPGLVTQGMNALAGALGFGSTPTGLAGMNQSMPIMSPNWPVISANANGNVFSNGVFDAPTAFRFASGSGFGLGVMGEAGPEAVMPLTRGPGGKLGVMAQGGGAPTVTVNVINAPGTTAQVQQRSDGSGGVTLDVIIEQIEGGIARNVSRGTGTLNGALTRTFGLNRAAGAY